MDLEAVISSKPSNESTFLTSRDLEKSYIGRETICKTNTIRELNQHSDISANFYSRT
jgi:hypothetical protein